MSVTKIQWYDEDKCFAIAFSDGVVSLSTKDSYIAPIIIDAHQVTSSSVMDPDQVATNRQVTNSSSDNCTQVTNSSMINTNSSMINLLQSTYLIFIIS